uniref:Uncharacterized protein n=1 Tax=Anopheles epiroticus TaxID=199890 RepID=A0A182PWI7_9DIPT
MRSIACSEMKTLDDEGLLTLLGEAERMLNSRPLTYIPLDSEESEALTPNHCLLGNSCGSKPLLEHDCMNPMASGKILERPAVKVAKIEIGPD